MKRFATLSMGMASAVALGLASQAAFAAGIAYEPFNYPANTQITDSTPSNGLGFSSWRLGSGGTVQGGSLSYPGLATSGNSLALNNTQSAGENFDSSAETSLNALGTTVYYSALIQPTQSPDASDYMGFALTDGNTGLFVGQTTSDNWGLQRLGGEGSANPVSGSSDGGGSDTLGYWSNVAAANGTTVFLVIQDIRPSISTGLDTINLYVNPTPGAALPATPDVTLDLNLAGITINHLFIGSNDESFNFDEFRAGTTFADVSPVPLPASAWSGLALLGGLGLLGAVKRHRKQMA